MEVAQEPMLALDGKMRLVAANRAFNERFTINTVKLIGKPVYELADGQWNIAGLRDV